MSAPAAAITSSSGGATPADSPFLRRPDLLRSLIGFWQNHPSLSLSVFRPVHRPHQPGAARRRGPRRQPYELDIASTRFPIRAATSPPWLVDRILRNLLIDVTGNTHRAEFCIDKLYSPDGPTGRLGLVELRAFEMPPHARMSSRSNCCCGPCRPLLVRALSAAAGPLGTGCTTVSCCRISSGRISPICWPTCAGPALPSTTDWFAPHFEFRFPRYGAVRHARRRAGIAPGPGALACDGRGAGRRRHRPLCRFLRGTAAGQGAAT